MVFPPTVSTLTSEPLAGAEPDSQVWNWAASASKGVQELKSASGMNLRFIGVSSVVLCTGVGEKVWVGDRGGSVRRCWLGDREGRVRRCG